MQSIDQSFSGSLIVINNVKVKYQGHVSQKMGVSGALMFHIYILFLSLHDFTAISSLFVPTGTAIDWFKRDLHLRSSKINRLSGHIGL